MSYKPQPFLKIGQRRYKKLPANVEYDWEMLPEKREKPKPYVPDGYDENGRPYTLHKYWARFEDGREVTYSTDCHITSSQIWAEIYFGSRLVAHGMFSEGKVYLMKGGGNEMEAEVKPDTPHFEFTPQFSNKWIDEQGPEFNYHERANAIMRRKLD